MFKKAIALAAMSVLASGAFASLPDADAPAQKGSFVQVAARDIASSVSLGADVIPGSDESNIEKTGHHDDDRRDPYKHTPTVPEPETYALMLAGLGAVVFMLRRRRN